jgi:hypothetical protein
MTPHVDSPLALAADFPHVRALPHEGMILWPNGSSKLCRSDYGRAGRGEIRPAAGPDKKLIRQLTMCYVILGY